MHYKALVAAVGIVAVAGSPAFAATAAKTTTLSEHAAKSVVKAKAKDTITGTLTYSKKALPGQKVVLEQRLAGAKKFTVVATHTTGSKGGVSFTVTPSKGKHQYELVFAGTKTYKASHSSIVTVTAT
jgi:hypothetical protein